MKLYDIIKEAPGDPAIDNATMTGSTPQQRLQARQTAVSAPAGQPKTKGTVAVNKNPRQDGDFSASRRTGTNAGILKVASNGVAYTWLGRQWADNETGRMATKAVAAELGNPMLDELIGTIHKTNTAHLVADYILGRERSLDTDARRSSGSGRSYADIDKAKSKAGDADTLDNVKPNRAINQTQNDNDDFQADQRVSQQKFAQSIDKPTTTQGEPIPGSKPGDQQIDPEYAKQGAPFDNVAGTYVEPKNKGIKYDKQQTDNKGNPVGNARPTGSKKGSKK